MLLYSESQYEAGLLGGHPWEIPQVYHDRSPLYMASSIRSPVLVLQGKEDKVVPPNQSEAIVAKIKENKGKVRYLEFEGEGHGFRQAANMRKAIEEERKWYEEVLGLQEVKAGTQ